MQTKLTDVEISVIEHSAGPDLDDIAKALRMRRNGTVKEPEHDDSLRARLLAAASTAYPTLTTRERAVAELLILGKPNREIAVALDISIKTVDTHRGHVMQKLEVANNVELLRLAVRKGWAVIELEGDLEVS